MSLKLYDEQPDPGTRLNELFTEADQIIEAHPELVSPMDEDQFKRIENLVEDVDTDLPTRLRELLDEINAEILVDLNADIYYMEPPKTVFERHSREMARLKLSQIVDKLEPQIKKMIEKEITDELEKEGAGG